MHSRKWNFLRYLLTSVIVLFCSPLFAMNDDTEDPSDNYVSSNYALMNQGTEVFTDSSDGPTMALAASDDNQVQKGHRKTKRAGNNFDFNARIPQNINPPGEKVVVVDPRAHVWAAYNPDGQLVRAGIASAGKNWCPDTGRPCRTKVGVFRIYSLGSPYCRSRTFPLPRGGAPMPYCMFFNKGQALHGVPPHEVGDANLSHGCVRLHTSDAEWLRYNFVTIGTKVIIRPY